MSDYADIIARLETAQGQDRELDLAIGELVGEASHDGPAWRRPFRDWAKHYTASIDAALTLLPDEDHHWMCGYSKHVRHNAEVRDLMHPHKGVFVGEHDHSRAIALCIAALKARMALKPPSRETE